MKATIEYYGKILAYLFAMLFIGCVMFFLWLGHCLCCPFKRRHRQKRARKGLTEEQCALLERLWEADTHHYNLACQAAKYRSHSLRADRKKADEVADALHLQCIEANIPTDLISAFLLVTYEFKG